MINKKIIIDAMGGDNAPEAIIEGCLMAVNELKGCQILLCGKAETIQPLLTGAGADNIQIVNAEQKITADDSPVKAIKEKPNSSLVVGLNLLSQNKDGMFLSAGNTGALVAGATLIAGRIMGIKRPALAPVLPTQRGSVLLIDGGANVDCKPQYLLQFGLMGSIYMHQTLDIQNPRVGLINNGSETEKGNTLTKAAYELLSRAPINFVGNAEGRNLLDGDYDVLVCDGFIGNILLKFVEGCAFTILDILKENIMASTRAKIGAWLMKGAFRNLKKKMDYKEYGGALLLGINGGVMKMHGSSDSKAVQKAILSAEKFISKDVVGNIARLVTEGTYYVE